MRKIIPCLLKLACVLALAAGVPAEAANKNSQKSSAASVKKPTTASKKAPGTKKSTTSKKTSKSKGSSGGSGGRSVPRADNSVASERETPRCRNVRVKTSKGYRTQRKCGAAEAAALHGGATDPVDSGKSADLKARTIPDRAYAVDGYTFFHQGRKYRILGIDESLVPAGSDLAKQRLQLALDSGQVAVEPESVDDSGTVRAQVRVSGKNLAEVLNAK